MHIYADDPIKGKILFGEFNPETGELSKTVIRAKHFFRLFKGYALQETAFKRLMDKGLKIIKIEEQDTGNTLISNTDEWIKDGGKWTGKNGRQVTLSEKFMDYLKQ